VPTQTEKATNLKVTGTNTTKDKTRRRTRKARKEASTTDSIHEKVGTNVINWIGNLLSGPYDQY